MGKYISIGELAEGKKCDIQTRKHVWKGLAKDPITNSNLTLYELDRNCSVCIVEALPLETEEDVKVREEKNVHRNVGDELSAEAIQLFVDIKRDALKFEVAEGQSGRHGAELAHTTKRTVGKIKYPLAVYKEKFGFQISSPDIKSIE